MEGQKDIFCLWLIGMYYIRLLIPQKGMGLEKCSGQRGRSQNTLTKGQVERKQGCQRCRSVQRCLLIHGGAMSVSSNADNSLLNHKGWKLFWSTDILQT